MPDAPLREHTAAIVAAYLTRNPIAPDQLAPFIASVHQALADAAAATPPLIASDRYQPEPGEPPIAIDDSLGTDYIVCLECGEVLIRLAKHLGAAHSLTPHVYRQRWNLPDTYPMSAPLSALRSSLHAGRPKGRVLQ